MTVLIKVKKAFQGREAPIALGLYFFSLPIGKSLWLPLFYMCIRGGYFVYTDVRNRYKTPSLNLLLFSVACIFMPALLSAVDSIVPARTLKYLLEFPLFVLVAYFIMRSLENRFDSRLLVILMAVTALFWSLCSYWQFMLPDFNPFPEPRGARFQGVFGRSEMILGYSLAAIIPFLVFGLSFVGRQKTAVVLFVLLAATCFLSGNRASWISVLVFTLMSLGVIWLRGWRPTAKGLLSLVLASSIVLVLAVSFVKGTSLAHRFDRTVSFFKDPNLSSFESASAGRGSLWIAAVEIGLDHPVNGVGVNNFRFAHPDYMDADDGSDRWLSENKDSSVDRKYVGAFYPHQLVLQQFAGAGLPGLAGILSFYTGLFFLTISAVRGKNLLVVGAALAVWAGFFPLNTHLNFHGGWLTANFWVWVGIFLGLLGAKENSRGVQSTSRDNL